MSGTGPESIPTSADPRSKRPTKKRALTPVSAQAATVEALFAKPDQEIRLPPPVSSTTAGTKPRSAVPPEIVTNVQGSSAGAGSGEFHVYKAARRREYARLRAMDAETARERESAEFEAAKTERERRDEEKTRRNREKRERKNKLKAQHKGKKDAAGGGKEGLEKKGIAPRIGGNAVRGGDEGDEDTMDTRDDSKEAPAAAVPTSAEAGLLIHEDD